MQKKEASLLATLAGTAGTFAAGEIGMRGLQQVGKKSANDLVDLGLQQGKHGLKMNPLSEKNFRNFLGNKQFEPYTAGHAIGQRIKGKPVEYQERFVNKTRGMAQAHQRRLEGEHQVSLARQRFEDPFGEVPKLQQNSLIDAVAKYDGTKKGPLKNTLARGAVPVDKNTPVLDLVGNVTGAPAALLDHRIAARPLIRGAESTNAYQKIKTNLGTQHPKANRLVDMVRDWYD